MKNLPYLEHCQGLFNIIIILLVNCIVSDYNSNHIGLHYKSMISTWNITALIADVGLGVDRPNQNTCANAMKRQWVGRGWDE